MIAVVRRALEIIERLRADHNVGEVLVPPAIAALHGHSAGAELTDELIEDLARHHSSTVYHLTSTCRIGSVVDAGLRVLGVDGRKLGHDSVADALKLDRGKIELLVSNSDFYKILEVAYRGGAKNSHLQRDAAKSDLLEVIGRPLQTSISPTR